MADDGGETIAVSGRGRSFMPSGRRWPMIDELPERGGGRASLCTGWRVRDVFAHMTATAKMTPIGFVGKFAAAGFRFTVLTANGGTAGDIRRPRGDAGRFPRALTDPPTRPGRGGDARRGDHSRRRHPPAARHRPRLPRCRGRPGSPTSTRTRTCWSARRPGCPGSPGTQQTPIGGPVRAPGDRPPAVAGAGDDRPPDRPG